MVCTWSYNMPYLAGIFLIFSMNIAQIPQRDLNDMEYIISGQNTIHKIHYATSSNYSTLYNGDNAMDSNTGTSWISKQGRAPHWIHVDFGIKRIMTSIIIYPGKKDNYRTLKYCYLQFMYHNKWFNFARVNFEESSTWWGTTYKNKVIIDLGGVDASAFRIYIPDGATYNGYAAIAEIEPYIGHSKIKYFDERLKGLFFPVKNGFLPNENSGFPNAPRQYRGGRHAGLDIFYYHKEKSYDPLLLTKETPIYAADSGRIIRADWNYTPMNAKEWRQQSQFYQSNPDTFVKRSFGGRQVWIDHLNGIVTTYNHLSRIDPGIQKEGRVRKGQRLGWAGNSGLLGEAKGNNEGIHLHFEIWIDGYYLGTGMQLKDIKKYITWIFVNCINN
jgi:hypothetical protein